MLAARTAHRCGYAPCHPDPLHKHTLSAPCLNHHDQPLFAYFYSARVLIAPGGQGQRCPVVCSAGSHPGRQPPSPSSRLWRPASYLTSHHVRRRPCGRSAAPASSSPRVTFPVTLCRHSVPSSSSAPALPTSRKRALLGRHPPS